MWRVLPTVQSLLKMTGIQVRQSYVHGKHISVTLKLAAMLTAQWSRSWLKKGKSAPGKPLPAAQLPPQNSATASEVEISSREPSVTGKSGWGLTGLLKRTKSDGARTRRTSFETGHKVPDGGSGTAFLCMTSLVL